MSNAIDQSAPQARCPLLMRHGPSFLLAVVAAVAVFGFLPTAFGAVLNVTNDYPTIQAAIDAAGSNDTIQVQPGSYRETLNILKSVHIMGSGYTNCIIHHTNDLLIAITSAGVVELAGMEITGGDPGFGGYYSPTVSQGIVASNTTVVLNDISLDNTRNFSVTVIDGALYATNVMLYTRIILQQWDVGFQLKGCFARIYHLTQLSGQIDHTININDPPANPSDVQVDNCTIQASHLDYGECVRTYYNTTVVITNCTFFRAPGGDPPTNGNQAVGINGYSNTVSITGNTFSNLPTGIRIFGSFPSTDPITIDHNNFINTLSNAVLIISMPYEDVDLGGGLFQSAGLNNFSNPGARDVELSNTTSDIHAEFNCWTTANPDDSIIDKTDIPSLGQVFYNPTCSNIALCALSPAVATNNVGTAQTFTATVTTNSAPVSGINVSFSVSGANAVGVTNNVTDSNGQTSFTYTGFNAGSDTITATGSVGFVQFSGQATQVWLSTNTIISITCPLDISTNTSPGACAITLSYNVQATGTPPPVVTINPPSGSSFTRGITGVTATASNATGTVQCSFTVTVADTQAPALSGCPSNHLVNCYDEVPPAPVVTAIDNCDTNIVVNFSEIESKPGLSCSNVITRTWTATDSNGNTNSCTQTIVVYDTTAPVITCPATVTTNTDANACSASGVVLGITTATDNCLGSVTVTNNAPSVFPKGTNGVLGAAVLTTVIKK